MNRLKKFENFEEVKKILIYNDFIDSNFLGTSVDITKSNIDNKIDIVTKELQKHKPESISYFIHSSTLSKLKEYKEIFNGYIINIIDGVIDDKSLEILKKLTIKDLAIYDIIKSDQKNGIIKGSDRNYKFKIL